MSANVSIFLINWLVSYMWTVSNTAGVKSMPSIACCPGHGIFPKQLLSLPGISGRPCHLKAKMLLPLNQQQLPLGVGQRPSFIIAMAMTSNAFGLCVEKEFEVFASSAQHGGSLWWDVGMLGRACLFVKLYSLDSRSLSWIKATSPFRENVFTLHYRWHFLSFQIFIDAQLIEKRATSETNQQKTLVFNKNKIAARYKMSSPQKYWKSVHNRCTR